MNYHRTAQFMVHGREQPDRTGGRAGRHAKGGLISGTLATGDRHDVCQPTLILLGTGDRLQGLMSRAQESDGRRKVWNWGVSPLAFSKRQEPHHLRACHGKNNCHANKYDCFIVHGSGADVPI